MTDRNRHEPDTERVEALYRQAADVEPEPHLDEAVLGRARMAASKPRRQGLRRPGAWGMGIAAAASLVLAVGIVFHQGWQPSINDVPGVAEPSGSLMKDAEGPAAPRAERESMRQRSEEESAARTESAEFDRIEVTGSRIRREDRSQAQAAQQREANQAGLAAPEAVTEDEQLSPEAWLERILAMAEQGRVDEARDELRKLKADYPSVEIPVEVREALAADPD